MTNNLENIFIQIPSFIFVKNLKSEFIGCNQHFARAAGLESTEDIKGLSDFDMPWAESHAELYRQGDREVLSSQPKLNLLETQRKAGGDIITIQINKVPLLDYRNQITGLIGVYRKNKRYIAPITSRPSHLIVSPEHRRSLISALFQAERTAIRSLYRHFIPHQTQRSPPLP